MKKLTQTTSDHKGILIPFLFSESARRHSSASLLFPSSLYFFARTKSTENISSSVTALIINVSSDTNPHYHLLSEHNRETRTSRGARKEARRGEEECARPATSAILDPGVAHGTQGESFAGRSDLSGHSGSRGQCHADTTSARVLELVEGVWADPWRMVGAVARP